MSETLNGNSPGFVEALGVLQLLGGAVQGCESAPDLPNGTDIKVWFAVLQKRNGYFLVPTEKPAHYSEALAHQAAVKAQDQGATKVFGPYHVRPNFLLDQTHIAHVVTGDGTPYTIGPNVDMLVWTPSAFEKFVAPYYYRQKGADYVKQLWTDLNESKSGIFEHWWPTFDMITAENAALRNPKQPMFT